MKTFLNLCSAASVVCLLVIAASDLGFTAPLALDQNAGRLTTDVRPVLRASFAPPVVLNAHARSKVVQYFDTYRSEPLGLPPGCAAKVGRLPTDWGNPGIASGTVIPDGEREFLIDVPMELVRVLAAQSEVNAHYCLAGNQLVAVDSFYKVLDSVSIPTVRLDAAGDLANVSGPRAMVRR